MLSINHQNFVLPANDTKSSFSQIFQKILTYSQKILQIPSYSQKNLGILGNFKEFSK